MERKKERKGPFVWCAEVCWSLCSSYRKQWVLGNDSEAALIGWERDTGPNDAMMVPKVFAKSRVQIVMVNITICMHICS